MQRPVDAHLFKQLGYNSPDDPGDQVSDQQDDQKAQDIGDEAEQRIQGLLDAVGDELHPVDGRPV